MGRADSGAVSLASEELVAEMVALARPWVGDTVCPVVLSPRSDGVVVRAGDLVLKAHPPETDHGLLVSRLRVAASDALRDVLLAPRPLRGGVLATWVRGRLVTGWPVGEPVDPDDPDAAPWAAAARLLARLHTTPVNVAQRAVGSAGAGLSDALPPGGAPARVVRAMERLRRQADDHPAADIVRQAAATLPRGCARREQAPQGRPLVLTHGDWHLGQLARLPGVGWRLLDIDDLGLGDPAWDLARPAAWFAAGLMPPEAWGEFLDSYRAAGGVAVRGSGDPWPALDVPARALVAQSAALAVSAAGRQERELDEWESAMVEACRRIVAELGRAPRS